MSTSASHTSVLMEVQQRIRELEEAISRVSTARDHLKQSAMEVKSDIQRAMTEQLGSLREREVALLRQVDVAQQAKDSALQSQQHSLHQALGGLTHLLNTGDLASTLHRLSDQELEPAETTHIAFKANVPVLHNAISSFGSVDIQRLPVSAMFDHDYSSKSLPSAFEEYEDEDHHILYKTIADTGENQGPSQISVTIPQLSRKPEDWLLQPTSKLQHVVPSRSAMDDLFPPFISENLLDHLECHDRMNRSESSVASIQQWLCDLQGQGEGEETDADFEVISPSSYQPSSSIEVLNMEDVQPNFFLPSQDYITNSLTNLTITPEIQAPATLSYFQQVLAGPSTAWLLNAVASSSQASSVAYCNEVLRYFRDISNDTKDWLLQYNGKKECEDAPCTASTLPQQPMDIENLDQLVCVQDPISGYFAQVTSDPRRWLLVSKDEDLDWDEAEVHEEVAAVCKANEPCQSFRDCVCDDNCCSLLPSIVPAPVVEPESEVSGPCEFPPFAEAVDKNHMTSWLSTGVKVSVMSERVADILPPFTARASENWAVTTPVHSQEDFGRVHEVFSQIENSSANQWVISESNITSNDLNKTTVPDPTEAWATRFCHMVPSVSSPKHHPTSPSNAPWLLCSSKTPEFPSLDAVNISDAPLTYQEKGTTVSWLLNTSSEGQGYTQKMKDVLCMKRTELPECEDEPIVESQLMQNDLLFSCFHKKQEKDNDIWLAGKSMLVD